MINDTILKRIFQIWLILLLLTAGNTAQIVRTAGMGGLRFSISDKDQSINPYDFGGNPAWLYADEQESYLRITPTFGNSWGGYRQKYDSEGNLNAGTSFYGIKTLGSLGTFGGFTSYNYENRRNYYRTLKKDTYNGEAFYFNDTTSSDFRYMGPKVILMYSWEPAERLSAGGYVSYELLDGLKEQFSYAKTIYRNTEIKAGLAYRLLDELVIGADFKYFDSQESVEASDVNLLDVDLYYFRGDNFFVSKRGSSMTGKIRKQGITMGTQLYWDDGTNFSVALQSNYTPSNSKLLRSYYDNTSSQSFSEAEDSYAAFENFDLQLMTQYKFGELLFGGYLGYFKDNSWSKISMKDLMIWQWDVKKIVFGLGGSYHFSGDLLLGIEYEFTYNAADSSKYIDKYHANLKSNDHSVRMGAEYLITDDLSFRAGFNYGIKELDLFLGGSDVKLYKATCGFGFPLFDSMYINTNLQYGALLPDNPSHVTRKYFSGNISIELKSF